VTTRELWLDGGVNGENYRHPKAARRTAAFSLPDICSA